jgi:hypothetical protein
LLPPPLLFHDTVMQNKDHDTVMQNKDARIQQMTRLHKKRRKFSRNE